MVRVVVLSFVGMLLLITGTAQAVVVIETVTVGNPGNTGELSGAGAGGYGPDRECGAVDYVYRIGKFEVTAGQYAQFLTEVAATDTYGLYNPSMDSDPEGCQITQNGTSGSFTYDFSGGTDEAPGSTAADWENRPVNYVDWGDAARFANWLHNGQPTGAQDLTTTEDGSYYLNGAISDAELIAVTREPDATWVIPTEDEWYKAAYHYNDGVTGNYFDYPTSSDSLPGSVNDSGNLTGTGTPFTEGGTDPGNYATYDPDGDPNGIGSPYYRTEIGEWEKSISPYDTFDQGGNVFEWNEAVLDGSYRGLRGGSFDNYGVSLHAASRDYYEETPVAYENFGFRVATFVDCNSNGIPDECDLDCVATIGMTGGSCSDVYPGCGTSVDNNGNGIPDECGPEVIPAISSWGLLIMALLGLVAGTVMFRGRRIARPIA